MNEPRRLYRSRTNKVFAGVCGGVGEYFNVDPVIIRILMVILTCFFCSGVIIYIAAIFIIPLPVQSMNYNYDNNQRNQNQNCQSCQHAQNQAQGGEQTTEQFYANSNQGNDQGIQHNE